MFACRTRCCWKQLTHVCVISVKPSVSKAKSKGLNCRRPHPHTPLPLSLSLLLLLPVSIYIMTWGTRTRQVCLLDSPSAPATLMKMPCDNAVSYTSVCVFQCDMPRPSNAPTLGHANTFIVWHNVSKPESIWLAAVAWHSFCNDFCLVFDISYPTPLSAPRALQPLGNIVTWIAHTQFVATLMAQLQLARFVQLVTQLTALKLLNEQLNPIHFGFGWAQQMTHSLSGYTSHSLLASPLSCIYQTLPIRAGQSMCKCEKRNRVAATKKKAKSRRVEPVKIYDSN